MKKMSKRVVPFVLISTTLTFVQHSSSTLLQQAENAKEFSQNKSVQETMEDIIAPSDTCKEIVALFGSAISNFTLCSVTNARPIHLCRRCTHHYRRVLETHHRFTATVDEKEDVCSEYFTNLDRIEIVTSAQKYVQNLWERAKCDYCFHRNENGTVIPKYTQDVVNFDVLYQRTKSCFNRYLDSNDTCHLCERDYKEFNTFYAEVGETDGDNICMDIVDTVNMTKDIWREVFHCGPSRKNEFWLHFVMAAIGFLPLVFYVSAFLLSDFQPTNKLHQKRMIEAWMPND